MEVLDGPSRVVTWDDGVNIGGQGSVAGTERPLAIEMGLALDRRGVDPEQPGRGAAQVAA
jgi:hypothetical protein